MTEFVPEKKKQVAENLSSLRHPRGLHHLLLTDEEFEILDAIQTLRQKSSPEGATFLEITTALASGRRMSPLDARKLLMI